MYQPMHRTDPIIAYRLYSLPLSLPFPRYRLLAAFLLWCKPLHFCYFLVISFGLTSLIKCISTLLCIAKMPGHACLILDLVSSFLGKYFNESLLAYIRARNTCAVIINWSYRHCLSHQVALCAPWLNLRQGRLYGRWRGQLAIIPYF